MSTVTPKPVAISQPALIPVVELEPAAFATAARSSPAGRGHDLPEAWNAYWKASIADRGLALEALPLPGSWSVPLDALTDVNALVTIATLAGGLEDAIGDVDAVSGVHALPGGYALADGDAFIWHAACCASLQDLAEWSALLTTPPEARFLGHTWVRSTSRGAAVMLGLTGEYETAESRTLLVEARRADGVLADARLRVERFRERLFEALRGHVPEERRRIIADELTRTA